jgi:hypothetical protein
MNMTTSINRIEIKFDETDTVMERNMVEYGLRNILINLQRFQQIEDRITKIVRNGDKE